MAQAQNYEWSAGARKHGLGKCDVQKAVQFLKQLERDGKLTREVVRLEAEKRANPLHRGSRWHWHNDEAAAESWRLQVASSAITGLREIVVERVDGEEEKSTLPVFVQSDKTNSRSRGGDHRSLDEIMRDPLYRAQYLTRMLRDIRGLEGQYSLILAHYPEVEQRWTALRLAIEEVIPPS